MRAILGFAAIGAGLLAASGAEAAELHVGALAHNICIQNCDNAGKEEGANIELQLGWDSPEALSILFSPRPYVIASINTSGDTSFFGGGLEWRVPVGSKWAIEPGLGYVLHNGETELPFPSGTPEAAKFTDEHVLLGSEDLFRLSLALTRDLPGPWAAQAMVLHVSHGQILGSGRNQGLDQAGFRLSYAFGE
jgi:lipid A 3-O-deacylase